MINKYQFLYLMCHYNDDIIVVAKLNIKFLGLYCSLKPAKIMYEQLYLNYVMQLLKYKIFAYIQYTNDDLEFDKLKSKLIFKYLKTPSWLYK